MHRYMICYSKQGPARYTAHLDLMRELERSMRRAKLPMAFSEGFNPHPKLSVAAPLPVGSASLAELAEIEMTRAVEPDLLLASLNDVLPPGLKIRTVTPMDAASPSLMAAVRRAGYLVRLEGAAGTELPGDAAVQSFLALDRVEIKRCGRDGQEKIRDIRPGIVAIEILPAAEGILLRMELMTGSAMNVRPAEAAAAFLRYAGLAFEPADLQITRTGLFMLD
ncbi:MAG: TIGR03936 family radical SAM-associated protein [Firmicutes bacterium]|nr:TIGR03936 family radical SAM-associated protein [Bacillota bacterium]